MPRGGRRRLVEPLSGIWSAAGVALVAIIGAVFLGEGMTWVQVSGIALVAAGVLALEFGAQHPHAHG